MQTQLIHFILHKFFSSLPAPAHHSHPCHHHIPTGRHPIIFILTLHMPKSPQSTMPYHLSHALTPPKRLYKSTLRFLSFIFPSYQRHPAHPSHHHPFRPLQTLQICNLHRPGFSPICQYTLDTSPVLCCYLTAKARTLCVYLTSVCIFLHNIWDAMYRLYRKKLN